MIAPYCKVCEHNHWLNEPHVWTGPKGSKSKALDQAKKRVAEIEADGPAVKPSRKPVEGNDGVRGTIPAKKPKKAASAKRRAGKPRPRSK